MRIVCVHQGYELYGSDRAFVESVAALRSGWPDAHITVVLSAQGPILAPLRGVASEVVIEPLFILRRAHLPALVLTAPFRLLPALWRAMRRMRGADLVYINTLVIADYLIAARLFRSKVVVHVHEIAEGSVMTVLRTLLRWSGGTVIFNSKACRAAYTLNARQQHHVVYNGIESPASFAPQIYDGSRALKVLMLGRINRIKGQNVLIEAIAGLAPAVRRKLEVRIVGNSFGNDMAREAELRAQAKAAGLDGIVTFEPFQDDTAPLYRWADIVAAPSRLPETLGRVAIEAAAHARPTLASAIGGLPEVVVDGATGWLARPDDAADLSRILEHIVTDPDAWQGYGLAARRHYDRVFNAAVVQSQFRAVAANRLAEAGCASTTTMSVTPGGENGRH
jgi:glycosyltransferase involved in cell wall biosynthesis